MHRIDSNIYNQHFSASLSLQSDTCMIDIPELDCEFGASGLGGRFTTIEGILSAIRDQVLENSPMFQDSAEPETRIKMEK